MTQQPVKLLEGRYGPYVNDGQTNASLPKGLAASDVTLEQALQLLAERADKAPATKPRRKTAKKPKK